MTRRFWWSAPAALMLLWPAPVQAQIHASEPGRVSQTVDGTVITVDYSRPRARGRQNLFGGEVKWGEVWTPGANYATTLEVNHDVQINGHPVPQGKYSVWMTVRQDSAWTVIFDTTTRLYHTEHPGEQPWQIRFDVTPERRDTLEVLTWSFPVIRSDGAVLVMHWGDRYVPLDITVPPSRPTTTPADLARRFLGTYRLEFLPDPGDTTHFTPPPSTFQVFYQQNSLYARWDPPPFPGMDTLLLMPITDEWLISAMLKDGAVFDVMDDMVLEFELHGDRAAGFEVRMADDLKIASARRVE